MSHSFHVFDTHADERTVHTLLTRISFAGHINIELIAWPKWKTA